MSRVIEKCWAALAPTGVVPVDDEFHKFYGLAYEDLAGRGERVLACAMLHLDGSTYPDDFEFTEQKYPQEGMVRQ